MSVMEHIGAIDPKSILSDEFELAVAQAGARARQAALAGGHAVVFQDKEGRYVQEWPDGRRFEVAFLAEAPRESHMRVLRELEAAKS